MQLLDSYEEQASDSCQRKWKINLNQTEFETVVWWGRGRKGNISPKIYKVDT